MKKKFYRREGKFTILNNGYKFHRPTFFIMAAVIALYVGAVFFYFLFNPVLYVHCPDDTAGFCYNGFYERCDDLKGYPGVDIDYNSSVCTQELLNPGYTYGKKPPFWASDVLIFSILIMGGFFLFNDLKHNNKGGKRG